MGPALGLGGGDVEALYQRSRRLEMSGVAKFAARECAAMQPVYVHGNERAGEPEDAIVREVAEHVVDDEEPEPVRGSAHECAEQVDAHRRAQPEGGEQDVGRPGEQNEQRVPQRRLHDVAKYLPRQHKAESIG